MKYRTRIYYTEEQKTLMWDRWQKGESLSSIARLFDRGHSSIEGILKQTGGIRLSITKVYPPPCHQGNSPTLGVIIISSLSGFVGFGWENFSQPVASWEV